MKRIIFIAIFLYFISCGCISNAQSFEENFMRSIKQNNFSLLQDHLPTIAFYKSLPEAKNLKDAEIEKFLQQSNDRLKGNWQEIIDRMKANAIDPALVTISESLIYDPFTAVNEMKALVILYSYKDQLWDDLTFIVSPWENKILLLEIPNPTKAFSFSDTSLRAWNEAKNNLQIHDTAFKKSMEEKLALIISAVKNKDINTFADCLLYRGDDEARKWASALNKTDPAELQMANEFLEKINNSLKDCAQYTTGEIFSEKESEGEWIILPIQCSSKTVQFAFLKVKDQLLLGDVDAKLE